MDHRWEKEHIYKIQREEGVGEGVGDIAQITENEDTMNRGEGAHRTVTDRKGHIALRIDRKGHTVKRGEGQMPNPQKTSPAFC